MHPHAVNTCDHAPVTSNSHQMLESLVIEISLLDPLLLPLLLADPSLSYTNVIDIFFFLILIVFSFFSFDSASSFSLPRNSFLFLNSLLSSTVLIPVTLALQGKKLRAGQCTANHVV